MYNLRYNKLFYTQSIDKSFLTEREKSILTQLMGEDLSLGRDIDTLDPSITREELQSLAERRLIGLVRYDHLLYTNVRFEEMEPVIIINPLIAFKLHNEKYDDEFPFIKTSTDRRIPGVHYSSFLRAGYIEYWKLENSLKCLDQVRHSNGMGTEILNESNPTKVAFEIQEALMSDLGETLPS